MSGQLDTVQIHYTDLMGVLRGVEVSYESFTNSEFPASFDGSSVGFAPVESSDLLLKPLRDSLRPVPWLSGVGRAIGMIYTPKRERLPLDPRYVAEMAQERAMELGYLPLMGAELEFFLFSEVRLRVCEQSGNVGISLRSPESPYNSRGHFGLTKKSYHGVEPIDHFVPFRLKLSEALRALGYPADIMHHEVALSQIEMSLGAGSPAWLGDEVVTAKWAARNVAKSMGLVAVFLPKPIYGDNGSGMHLHVSLWDRERKRNLFNDERLMRHFIGGVLEHARSLAAIVAPTTNSYRRLVPGYEAPVYIAWGYYNRTAIIRIPATNGESRTRIEFRAPDPTANPYLAAAALLMAGLDGIQRRIDPGDPYNGNLYALSKEERRRLGIKSLPGSLLEALDELESDHDYLRPVFPKELIGIFIEKKRKEAEEVLMRPHPIEFYLYMNT